MLATMDSVGEGARMETHGLIRNVVAVYLANSLYDSLKFDAMMSGALPAARACTDYLSMCGSVDFAAPYESYGKRLRRRLDSCKAAIHQWDGWRAYEHVVDSMGTGKISAVPGDAYLVQAIHTCNTYRVVVSMGLPEYLGFSSKEQYIARFNRFNRQMVDAVMALHAQRASPFTGPLEIGKLKACFNSIRAGLIGKQADLRMAFYNEVGSFISWFRKRW